jgi:hypothetical protein
MKVKNLLDILRRLDPEDEVFATTDDLTQWHFPVADALPAWDHGGYVEPRSRRTRRANVALIYVTPATW